MRSATLTVELPTATPQPPDVAEAGVAPGGISVPCTPTASPTVRRNQFALNFATQQGFELHLVRMRLLLPVGIVEKKLLESTATLTNVTKYKTAEEAKEAFELKGGKPIKEQTTTGSIGINDPYEQITDTFAYEISGTEVGQVDTRTIL